MVPNQRCSGRNTTASAIVANSTTVDAGNSRLIMRPHIGRNSIPPRRLARNSCPVIRNPVMRKNTSTPPETRPSHTWYTTTSTTANARSPCNSGR